MMVMMVCEEAGSMNDVILLVTTVNNFLALYVE